MGPLTVTVPTLIPEPKKASVTPFVKLVNAPFRMTVALVPCTADTGLMAKSVGWPGVTVKPPTCCAVSLPVVRMTVRDPSPAPGLTLTFNVACVASLTDTELTVIPAPTLAVVVPFSEMRELSDDGQIQRFGLTAGRWSDGRDGREAGGHSEGARVRRHLAERGCRDAVRAQRRELTDVDLERCDRRAVDDLRGDGNVTPE